MSITLLLTTILYFRDLKPPWVLCVEKNYAAAALP
jgi:hypothetical protein